MRRRGDRCMIKGVGIDLVELERMSSHTDDEPFIKRILTPAERDIFSRLDGHRKIEFLAGRFSAKEAYAKAKGTGIGSSLSFQDLTIVDDPSGQPVIHDRTAAEQEVAYLSITHTGRAAAAVAVIESLSEHTAY